MIPIRISLKGFLCYKDEQEISFDSNATLWMLSGLNGSGKSSIFDAVTYALFGHHRGGSQHAAELINKDSDGLSVEFDFRLENQVYRVRRTLRRTAKGASSSTQQIYRYEANGQKNWIAVEGSNYRQQFTDWISEKIGLTYETFTSSVLLLQGKAEKLLGSKPEERRAVLASIVDLERYEQLHEKADEQRKKLKIKLDEKHNQLEALPEVKPEQIAQAEEAIHLAEEARQQANAEVDRLRELEVQARDWMALQGKLAEARRRRQHAEQLLEKAVDIERDLERLGELRKVLPGLREIIKQRGTIRDAELSSKELQQHKEKATEQCIRLDNAFAQEREKRTILQKRIEEDEKQQRELSPQLIAAAAQMKTLEEYEKQFQGLEEIRKQLALLPADAAEEVDRARSAYERLATLAQLVPQLERFQEQREALRQARQGAQSARQLLIEVETRGKQSGAECKRLEPLVQAADRAARQAKDRETEVRTLLKRAQGSLHEIAQMDGETRCQRCGQDLTPEHLQDEKNRREQEAQQLAEQSKKAADDLASAQAEENRLRKQEQSAKESYEKERENYRKAKSQQEQANADVMRWQDACGRAYRDLDERWRRRISAAPAADWLETVYPQPLELEELHAEIAGHSSARQRCQQAEAVLKKWNHFKTLESEKVATLHRLQTDLPAERESLRRKHADLKLNHDSLERELNTKRSQIKGIDGEVERLLRDRQREQERLEHIHLELKKKELEGQSARQMIAAHQKALPASWRPLAEEAGTAEYNQWDTERAALEATGVEQRGQELLQARVNRDVFRQDIEALEARLPDFVAESRRDPDGIKAELKQAKDTEKIREKELSEARQQLGQLESYRKQREQIGEEQLQLEREWTYQKALAELLGRDRLQLYLVRQAEKQVVEHANAVLDRLSGGQLYLKLRGEAEGEGNSGKALELEAYNRVTGEKPINVAFLSGSQKFRVAVSLALGIGQYASRQHRPIESVIIDEGFGCLDSQGRQVMIQELQNLRSQMRCILLVSHQEDFAEAFSDGYRFELEAGATRVKRFQR